MVHRMPKPDSSPFKILLPNDLKERLEAAAEKNRRSVTGEIIYALEQAYPAQPDDFGTMFLSMFDDLMSLADAGRKNDLTNRIQLMNYRLGAAGHGHIQFYLIEEGEKISVGSKNLKALKKLGRLEEALSRQQAR
jgi:hypothetical protein